MAKDELPSSSSAGKGKKAEDTKEINGGKYESKDGKPVVNGKKEEEPQEGARSLSSLHKLFILNIANVRARGT